MPPLAKVTGGSAVGQILVGDKAVDALTLKNGACDARGHCVWVLFDGLQHESIPREESRVNESDNDT